MLILSCQKETVRNNGINVKKFIIKVKVTHNSQQDKTNKGVSAASFRYYAVSRSGNRLPACCLIKYLCSENVDICHANLSHVEQGSC